MSEDAAAVVKVVFIAGTGRSGTTILNSILGQVPGCFAAGEMRYVWERGMLHDHRCGCGEPFSACPVWTAVTADAFKKQPWPDAATLAGNLDRRLRVRRVPLMVVRWMLRRPPLQPHVDDATILRLYRSLSRSPGVDVIVDSSKLPPYGMLLRSLPNIELYIVHVVRDPRATAFSWRRSKATRDTATEATMPQLESWRSASLWLLWNLLTDLWWPPNSQRRVLVRYEDLVQQPAATVERVLQMIGMNLPSDLISGHAVALSPTHSVAGNPNRHDAGVVKLHSDDEWQDAMQVPERVVVTAITAPGLRRFGYVARTNRGNGRLERRTAQR